MKFAVTASVYPPVRFSSRREAEGMLRLEVSVENKELVQSLFNEVMQQIKTQQIPYVGSVQECFESAKNCGLNILTSGSCHRDSVKRILEIVRQNPSFDLFVPQSFYGSNRQSV